MKIIIANGNKEERQQLLQVIREETKICDVEETEAGIDTIKLVKAFQPDLLIIDGQLPDVCGLETVELIRSFDRKLKVIITSSELEHAVAAFRLKSFYFLLKPLCWQELSAVLTRFQKEQTNKWVRKLHIECKDSIIYINPADIRYIVKNKEDKMVSIYTADHCYTSSYTLQYLEEKLNTYLFVRVHKSYLVNLRYITELKTFYNGTYNLYVEGCQNEPIPVSRNYVKRLRHCLEI
ncbi:LytR/AlgR family response regulator transcription factor [Bacillus songklensis]|uniref:LytR/AlgR family response regulator transcription factor n=1 Tax=Bacillus songklensis TaxID=1069116 RepID=A0ABV8B4Q9_9BACI